VTIETTFELFGVAVPCWLLKGELADGRVAIRFANGTVWYVPPDSAGLPAELRRFPIGERWERPREVIGSLSNMAHLTHDPRAEFSLCYRRRPRNGWRLVGSEEPVARCRRCQRVAQKG